MVQTVYDVVKNVRGIDLSNLVATQKSAVNSLEQVAVASNVLDQHSHKSEAGILKEVYQIAITSPNFGGSGLAQDAKLKEDEEREVLFLCEAWLESLNSADRAARPLTPAQSRPAARRPMTMTEKIFAMHDVSPKGYVKPGQVIRVAVDWIMASELSWGGMKKTYDTLGQPGIFRNDRFWLAGDHVVYPGIDDRADVKKMIKFSEEAKRDFKMTQNQGMNYTIMHTEFYRQRAQPGMLVIGSDSHTCSSGAASSMAIGLGAPDVTMALVTGQTWFRVPETVQIRFVGEPNPGIGGKDVILYILQQLKRNTVAADRVVEFTGPGAAHLSGDARFAICNMTTEFGGITGLFVPDQITYELVNSRKNPRYKSDSIYTRPDPDAEYAETHEIDLSNVEPFVAKYPNPDDVVPVSELAGMALDGCFIGACTTAEEDIILGALVLELRFAEGKIPARKGKRKVVPGSRPIMEKLRRTGLAEVYEDAGFEIGVPGCSYCVGISADVAGEGEVWLSSQNRNFENRMGKGSIGHISSAAAVAASSFDMKVTNPKQYLDKIDQGRLRALLSHEKLGSSNGSGPLFVEPAEPSHDEVEERAGGQDEISANFDSKEQSIAEGSSGVIRGKVQRFGDFIDTDALAPAPYLAVCKTFEEFGEHCLEYTYPDFREKVKQGYDIIVAGKGFGCGSSRAEAVEALLGCKVKCVIAESYAFIFARNCPGLGLASIVMQDPAFFELAQDGADLEVDMDNLLIKAGGKTFRFEFSAIEKHLMELGGIGQAFNKHGRNLFEVISRPANAGAKVFKPKGSQATVQGESARGKADLSW